jgi:hypothetical protein
MLADAKLIELVEERPRRGATELAVGDVGCDVPVRIDRLVRSARTDAMI